MKRILTLTFTTDDDSGINGSVDITPRVTFTPALVAGERSALLDIHDQVHALWNLRCGDKTPAEVEQFLREILPVRSVNVLLVATPEEAAATKPLISRKVAEC